MRILGIIAVVGMVGLAAFQSIFSGTPEGSAESDPFDLAQSDICTIEAMTLPVVTREARSITMLPAHKALTVTPARYGTRTEEVVIVPEHREGATFFTERKRVIVSEPTRRLRVAGPEFETVPAIPVSVKRARVSDGILIKDNAQLASGPATRIITQEARIEAVRINAGLKMVDVKTIDTDGEGELIPEETMPIEVRTVDSHPAVASSEVAAVIETHEIETVEAAAQSLQTDAVCSMAGRTTLVRKVQAVLESKGHTSGEAGEWSAETIDAMAAVQADETGLVSPYMLIETLREWVPDLIIPTS
jgi:hypothetical protein